jgi:hypothetical protein
MSDYDNTNTGAIFKNDKAGNDKRPDYKGSLNVEGVEYWISCWIRTGQKDGKKFMSAKVERKERQSERRPEPGRQISADDDSGPLPF